MGISVNSIDVNMLASSAHGWSLQQPWGYSKEEQGGSLWQIVQ